MTMDTDRLIKTLAADNDYRSRSVAWMLAVAMVFAVPVSSAIFMMRLGPRADISQAMSNPFFELKFVIVIALAIAATAVVLRLAQPAAAVGRLNWLFVIPAALIGIGVATDLLMPQQLSWSSRMIGSNSMICLSAIPLLSAPLLFAALAALRHGAATRPALSGAFAGLLSAGLAATLYASHCFDDSPLFVVTWYSIAIGGVTAIGAFVGSRVLKF